MENDYSKKINVRVDDEAYVAFVDQSIAEALAAIKDCDQFFLITVKGEETPVVQRQTLSALNEQWAAALRLQADEIENS